MKDQKKQVRLSFSEPKLRLLRGLADAEQRNLSVTVERALEAYAVASAEGNPAVRDLLEQTQ